MTHLDSDLRPLVRPLLRPLAFLLSCALALCLALGTAQASGLVLERDLAVPLRDGVVLRADVWRPEGKGRFPVLVCRTPYGKGTDPHELRFARKAVERGYAVVLQDVRGRFASEGDFEPLVNEGRDGFDTIEWAARQPWSDGRVGTFGLSYPGCAQWLAALETPPHLLAMAPAMSFASLRGALFYGGVFDADWVRWASLAMAPDTRARRGLPGPRTAREALREWLRRSPEAFQGHLPLADLPDLREAAPYLARWLTTPAGSPWWDFAELAGKYRRVTAAVLHLDGWHDDASGPRGALASHQGLVAARAGQADPRSLVVLGPWSHGIGAITGQETYGTRDFGPRASLDYDALVLDFMDLHVRGQRNRLAQAAAVRYFVMGANQWREAPTWPPPGLEELRLNLDSGPSGTFMGTLRRSAPTRGEATSFSNDPARPVRELPGWALGPMDQRSLLDRKGELAAFQSAPLAQDLTVVGNARAELYLSTDAPDVDLYVKLQDVAPDGTAYALMDAGAEVLRASLRAAAQQGPAAPPQLLEPGTVYRLDIASLLTANTFQKGHRIRVIVCASWFPAMSRNLQTGKSEATSAAMRPARITLHHSATYPSRLVLPVAEKQKDTP